MSRRETIRFGLFGLAVCVGLLGAKKRITNLVDENPNALQTRLKRNEKGQPFIQASNGDWLLLRTSPDQAGLILLRDRNGRVFQLNILGRTQVDLSDDSVVMDIFGDGKWESALDQLVFDSEDGDEEDEAVVLTEEEFFNFQI